MKILHLNSYYSASPFYRHLYDRQLERGNQLSVYVPVARGYDAKGRDFGEYACVSEAYDKYDSLLFHRKHQKILRDVKARYDAASYDVLHAHTLFSNGYIAHQLHLEHGTAYIVAVRNSDINVFFRYMPHLRPMARRILKAASRVIFISPAYREGEIRRYLSDQDYKEMLDKSVVLPNGISPLWLDNRAAPREGVHGEVKILSVGDINKNKNFETTIKAVDRLRQSGNAARLTVIGKPIDAKVLEKIKACEFCTVHEPMPQSELLKVYRAHDLFVLPSHAETFGLVYAEAMSQGLPVIYTRGQGFDGHFPDGEVGYRTSSRDAGEVAEKMKAAIANLPALSARCVSACERFVWHKIAAEYDRLYGEVTH